MDRDGTGYEFEGAHYQADFLMSPSSSIALLTRKNLDNFWTRPAGRRVLCNQLRPSVLLSVRLSVTQNSHIPAISFF